VFDPEAKACENDLQNFGRTIFELGDQEKCSKNILKAYPQNILFQNVDSYLGGDRDFWKRASQKSDIFCAAKRTILVPEGVQSCSDGKLELMTFTEGVKTGIWGKLLNKKPHRVAQSKHIVLRSNRLDKGPFLLTFKHSSRDDVVHMELDGEYFALEQPHSIYIQQSCEFINGKINLVAFKKKELRLTKVPPETKLIDFDKKLAAIIESKQIALMKKAKH
jgi:hypothetical protein